MLTADQVELRAKRDLDRGARAVSLESLAPDLRAVIDATLAQPVRVLRLVPDHTLRIVSPVGVIDLRSGTWVLREVPAGISAAEIQATVTVPLLCDSDLADVVIA